MATADDTTTVVGLEVDQFGVAVAFAVPGAAVSTAWGWQARVRDCGATEMGNELRRRCGEKSVCTPDRGTTVVRLRLNPHPRLRPACGRQARVRHPEIQRLLFAWCGRVGHPPLIAWLLPNHIDSLLAPADLLCCDIHPQQTDGPPDYRRYPSAMCYAVSYAEREQHYQDADPSFP